MLVAVMSFLVGRERGLPEKPGSSSLHVLQLPELSEENVDSSETPSHCSLVLSSSSLTAAYMILANLDTACVTTVLI